MTQIRTNRNHNHQVIIQYLHIKLDGYSIYAYSVTSLRSSMREKDKTISL